MNEYILKAVQTARRNSKKRNFLQSFDLIINLKLIDLKRPENRLNEIFFLPNGRGKDAEIVFFLDNKSVEDIGCATYNSKDIAGLSKNKRKLKKLANSTDFFLSEPKLMPIIGKELGRVLAPRGKMPTVVAGGFKEAVERYKKSIRIRVKDSPVVQCIIGSESMRDEDIAENVEALLKFLERKLPKGKNNIGKVLIKLTMGKPVKLSV